MNKPEIAPDVSVVIALFNEDESLPELHRQLSEVFEANAWTYDLLFIDDGSRDGSLRLLKQLAERDSHVKAISLRTNQGKSAALAVGFKAATGKYVITMDADLQDNPAEIPMLIAKLEEGYDLVSGWKKKRYDPLSKTIPSKLYNQVTGWLSGIRLHDFNCGLKAYRLDVVRDLFVYGELHRFLPVLAYKMGYRITEIPVVHRARQYGVSKFGWNRFLNGFLDLLTVMYLSGFKRSPLHLFGAMGLVCGLAGLVINIYLTIGWLQGVWIGNRPLLFLGVLLMVIGVQFFSIGLIAEMFVNSNERDREYPLKYDSRTISETHS
jgi:glycosyltransferase involved in cell wall biosynthesis